MTKTAHGRHDPMAFENDGDIRVATKLRLANLVGLLQWWKAPTECCVAKYRATAQVPRRGGSQFH
jgi:hypothetical protein